MPTSTPTPMQEHLAMLHTHPEILGARPDDTRAVVGYLIEPEQLVYLTVLSHQLHGGTDRERDAGHRLWLIINKMRDLPLLVGDLTPRDDNDNDNKPEVHRTRCALRSCGAEYWQVEGQHTACPACGNN